MAFAPGFQHQHLVPGIGAQPVGQHRAGRAGADDDEVKAPLVHFSPRDLHRSQAQHPGERNCWNSMAPASALTTLSKSISAPPPVSLTTRPPRRIRTGSARSVRNSAEPRDGAALVTAHQPQVGDHVRRDDCSQPALLPHRQSFLRWSEWIVGGGPQGEQWLGGSPPVSRPCTDHRQADDLMTDNRFIFQWNRPPDRVIRPKRRLEDILNPLKSLNLGIGGVREFEIITWPGDETQYPTTTARPRLARLPFLRVAEPLLRQFHCNGQLTAATLDVNRLVLRIVDRESEPRHLRRDRNAREDHAHDPSHFFLGTGSRISQYIAQGEEHELCNGKCASLLRQPVVLAGPVGRLIV